MRTLCIIIVLTYTCLGSDITIIGIFDMHRLFGANFNRYQSIKIIIAKCFLRK